MFHTIADFVQVWQEEGKNTEKLLSVLTEKSLSEQFDPNVRTLKQLAWHIIDTPHELLGHTGLKITGSEDSDKSIASIKTLIDTHNRVCNSVVHQVQTHWHNKDLHLTDNMYGQQWTRSQSLACLLHHMIHHRAQMTVLMRLAGLKVPGLYGPAKEEWTEFGMQVPEEKL